MSSVELSPPPDTPTTPAIVRKAAQQQREGQGGAAKRLQAVLAEQEVGEAETDTPVQGDGMDVDLPIEVTPVIPEQEATVPLPNTTPSRGGKATRNAKTTTDRIPRPINDASSSSSSDSSSSDEDDPTGATPLFDDALSNTKSNSGAALKITVNPKQPLSVDLPEQINGEEEPQREVYTYPPSCVPLKYLSENTQQIKLARFLKCRTKGCSCDGLKPPGFVPSTETTTDADADADGKKDKTTSRIILWLNPSHATDPAIKGIDTLHPSARQITEEKLWTRCGGCGCGWLAGGAHVSDEPGGGGGHTVPLVGSEGGKGVDRDELQRRRRVAYRAEEMLEVCLFARCGLSG